MYHTYGKMAAAFRGSLQPILKGARFQDDLWLEGVPDQCFASCWELADGGRLLILANDGEETVSFRALGLSGWKAGKVESMDTAIDESQIIGENPVEIAVPQGQLSYIVFR